MILSELMHQCGSIKCSSRFQFVFISTFFLFSSTF